MIYSRLELSPDSPLQNSRCDFGDGGGQRQFPAWSEPNGQNQRSIIPSRSHASLSFGSSPGILRSCTVRTGHFTNSLPSSNSKFSRASVLAVLRFLGFASVGRSNLLLIFRRPPVFSRGAVQVPTRIQAVLCCLWFWVEFSGLGAAGFSFFYFIFCKSHPALDSISNGMLALAGASLTLARRSCSRALPVCH
jgi:hypothetical protein